MKNRILPCRMHTSAMVRRREPEKGRAALGALVLAVVLALAWAACLTAPAAYAQAPPVRTINDEITAFAFAPDGRIAYAVRHVYKSKHYVLQRDDIWAEGGDGKRRRLVNSEKFILGEGPFSYAVDSLRWSPDGRRILAELYTMQALEGEDRTHDQRMLLMLEDDGKELKTPNPEIQVPDAARGEWMDGGQTVLYLREAMKPDLLFSINMAQPGRGPKAPAGERHRALFSGRTFVDAGFEPARNAVFAVERDRNLSGPPRLQRFDLNEETDTELATLGEFAGSLSISPSGAKAAFYIDREVLEIRDLTAPHRAARVRIGLGVFQWAPDEKRLLLKRSTEKKSGELVWIDVPPLAEIAARKEDEAGEAISVGQVEFQPILHGLLFRDFQISPDAKFLAVVPPGKRNLLIYPLDVR